MKRDPSVLFAEANELSRNGRYAAAIKMYDIVAQETPRNHWPRINAVMACARAGLIGEAWRRLAAIDNSQQLGAEVVDVAKKLLSNRAAEAAVFPGRIQTVSDYWTTRVNGNHLAPLRRLDSNKGKPAGLSFELELPKHIGINNDYAFIEDAVNRFRAKPGNAFPILKIVAFAWDQDEFTALRTWLAHQKYPAAKLSADIFIGSTGISSDVAFPFECRIHKYDVGSPVAQVNACIECDDSADVIVFLPMADANHGLVLEQIGHVYNVTDLAVLAFPATDETPAARKDGALNAGSLVSWKRELYAFRKVSFGNLIVDSRRIRAIGGFDCDIKDGDLAFRELAYRLYLNGAYFLPAPTFQSTKEGHRFRPKGKERFETYCAGHWYRKSDGIYKVPKVSIYVPSHNNGNYIVQSVNSVLSQNYQDLEVCIYDDGSTDSTLEKLHQNFRDTPRVRIIAGPNGGIGYASNRAVAATRGMYVGQLDSDDLLKPGAIKALVDFLDENREIGCVYSSCERIDAAGNYIKPEYSFPKYSREKMLTTSIAHHFRMFRRQCWARTSRFREDILNAVDYDMFLKMSELAPFFHIEKIYYQRRWHGNNTSLVNESTQTTNTPLVQKWSLQRQGIGHLWAPKALDPKNPRKISFVREVKRTRVFFWPDYSAANPYQKLLYAPIYGACDVFSGKITAAIKALHDNPGDGPVVFHLHWLNGIVDFEREASEVQRQIASFMADLKSFQSKGGKFVWTIHNAQSHDIPHPELERAFMEKLCQAADRIHLHAESSIREVHGLSLLSQRKIAIVPHGNYVGYYPDYVTISEARRFFGLSSDAFVIGFAGQIRPYKGLERLLNAFVKYAEKFNANLLIAGQDKCNFSDTLSQLIPDALRNRIIYRPGFIDDNDLQLYYKAASIVVFPYTRILTSGSALLSMGFGAPAVLPRVGMTSEICTHGVDGFLFNGETEDGLEQALCDSYQAFASGRLEKIGRLAKERALSIKWEGAKDLFVF